MLRSAQRGTRDAGRGKEVTLRAFLFRNSSLLRRISRSSEELDAAELRGNH